MKLVLVLGFYGLMVVSASAEGTRWPAYVCKDVASLRAIIESGGVRAEVAHERFGILLIQEQHCGVNVKAAQAEDNEVFSRSKSPPPRRPVFCDTTPKAFGGSYTDCF